MGTRLCRGARRWQRPRTVGTRDYKRLDVAGRGHQGGTGSSKSGGAGYITVIGTRLYLEANDGSGSELWAHETTNGSTWEVVEIDADGGYVTHITAMGTRLYLRRTTEAVAENCGHTRQPMARRGRPRTSTAARGRICKIHLHGLRLPRRKTVATARLVNRVHETTNGSTWMVADTYFGNNPAYVYRPYFTVVGTQLCRI